MGQAAATQRSSHLSTETLPTVAELRGESAATHWLPGDDRSRLLPSRLFQDHESCGRCLQQRLRRCEGGRSQSGAAVSSLECGGTCGQHCRHLGMDQESLILLRKERRYSSVRCPTAILLPCRVTFGKFQLFR